MEKVNYSIQNPPLENFGFVNGDNNLFFLPFGVNLNKMAPRNTCNYLRFLKSQLARNLVIDSDLKFESSKLYLPKRVTFIS